MHPVKFFKCFLFILTITFISEGTEFISKKETVQTETTQFSQTQVESPNGLLHNFFVKNHVNVHGCFVKKLSFFDFSNPFYKNQIKIIDEQILFDFETEVRYLLAKNHLIWYCVFLI